MRASRLLQLLLLLQNRGRLTTTVLARELEVARRTVIRDVAALMEAGLPVIVHRGVRGGVELGFNYRSRLTGLSRDEAEALGILLATPAPHLDGLGLGRAGRSARTKLLESLPDGVRGQALAAQARFRVEAGPTPPEDPRVAPLAQAIRERRRVRVRARSASPRTIHPIALLLRADGWAIVDALAPDAPIPLERCDDLNISALTFA